MKTYLMIAITLFAAPVAAQPAVPPAATPEISFRDQIKAARARDAAEEKTSSTARAWDRDVNGKRPWDIPVKAPNNSVKP
ncbi:hypothetical protein [Bradyrhizobium sp. CCBAU 11386]|uniref:hypothetical protein n=1 Tax=Bradyrhizobium sp. CCBAU 11386 TaxID=1630837 RepID=UPI002304189B|nr:hypothetical protein [Bradyrhizobium sp. CCBAU 11386]